MKFYASVRLDIRRIESIKEGQQVIGNRVRVKVVKNKTAPPFRQCEMEILFDEGISKLGEIIDLGVEQKLIEKSGAWYSYQSNRIGQGREQVRQYLRQNPEVSKELEQKIREAVGLVKQKTAGPKSQTPVRGSGVARQQPVV